MRAIWVLQVATVCLAMFFGNLTGATVPVITSTSTASGTGGSAFFYQITVANQQFAGVDSTGTYLMNTATNQPLFCAGEDAFDLIVELSNPQLETYLADRASRGFNCLWVALIDNSFQTNAPHDFYGNSPFDGADFTSEDAAYWAHVDYVLQRCAVYGLTIVASPAFVGLAGGEGYLTSIQSTSDSTMIAYGAWLGARYASYPNIIWGLGGDADPTTVSYGKMYDLAQGIRQSDTVHLLSFEACRLCSGGPYSSSDVWTGVTPLNLNWVYEPLSGVQAGCAANYAKTTSFLPNWMGEDWYEGEHSTTPLQLREEGYWEVLSGCTLGRLFGNNAIWAMGGPSDTMGASWQSQLGSAGSVSQQYLGMLFRSREFWKLIPDAHNTYLTAGYGSGTSISVLSRTSDGQTMIAYIPNGNATTITVNMAGIVSSTNTVHGWWFNPQTTASVNLSTFSNSGSHNFTPPDSNDWVLVLDDNAAGLAAPASMVMTAGSPALSFNATGLPAGLSVNTLTGLISGTPTATGTSSVMLSATNSAGTGTATLTLTTTGTGSPPAITSATTASGTAGSAFSYQITATNSPTSFTATGLPSGLSVNAAGLISGTPTAVGTSMVALSATNSVGTGTATLTLTITSTSPPTSISFVQQIAGASFGGTSSFSLSFSANTIVGDLILVGFDFDTNAVVSSVTDSQGNILTQVGNQLTSPGGSRGRVYYAKNIAGGADTVKINLSANSAWLEVYLTEYSGVDPTNPIDAQAGASGGAGPVSSSSATTSVSGDMIYGYCVADWACSAGSGFTARSTLNHNLTEDMTSGSAASYAATGTANNGWTMQMVALRPSSATTASPLITSATLASGTAGSAFLYQITATNSPSSFASTGLPSGLSVNAAGLISGTPTAAGTSMVALSATNSGGTGNATLTLTIAPATPAITSATSASGTAGIDFSYQITATNSPTSFAATGLPSGLSVNAAGLISGTPTAAGTSMVALSATNSGGTGHATLALTIAPALPAITSATSASGTAGVAFSYQITATNSPTSFAATGLPSGLSVNAAGLISGTSNASGTSMVALSATNSSGTGNATLTLTIAPATPVITSATSASGTTGSAFSYQITATNSPTSFAATGLPSGLSMNAVGLISGTPAATGASMVALSATNSGGTGNATLTLNIGPAASAAPVITSAATASGTAGSAFSYQITATNSPTSFAATGLPSGLSVNAAGLISGTPAAAGRWLVALSATNSAGTGSATLTLTIAPATPVITSPTAASGSVGSTFSYQITATNSPTSFAATGLPAGLSMNAAGLISGTPTAAGTSMVALSATNSGGTGSATLTLTIAPATPVITSATSASGTAGSAFSYQITATNSPTSFSATGLPSGLSVNGAGLISGTPTASGTSMVALSAANSGGTGNATLTLTIAPATPVITSATSASGTAGSVFSYQMTATNSPTSFAATGLPSGLSVNGAGLISGTPTAAGTSMVALSATNSGGTGNATLTLTIVPAAAPPAPVITSATIASATVGSAFSYQITATNSPTSFNATGLPAGLSVNAAGLISGTPTAAGTSSVTLSANNTGGTGTATLTLTTTTSSTSISFVQALANASPSSASSLSVSFPTTRTGDLILVAFDFDTYTNASSVTDSQGNTFLQVGNQLTSPGGSRSRVYYAKNIKGGTDTVTIALSATSSWIEAYLTEYSGVDPTNPIDVQAGASGNAGPVSSSGATTAVPGDMIYGYCVGDWACTAGSGFTARSTFNHNLIEDLKAGNPGSYSATGTANNGWTMQLVALKPAQ